MKLALVLPTRHRAAFAINAVQSLLSQRGCDVAVIVSDNSSREDEVAQLETFCRELGDPRLFYLRPPSALAMPPHWDWALGRALELTDATHFGIQYDRKLWKPDHLRMLAAACAFEPETLVTYACDFTYQKESLVGTWQMPASGRLYEIWTARVVEMAARGMIYEMGHAFPVLSNCMIPRGVLERVRSRFGNFCDSSTPDTAFAFRFCALEEKYLHFDRAVVIVYASGLSNAISLFRGERGGTWDDFAQLWGDRPWAPAAPIPDLRLGQNVSFHEYNLVQRVMGEERFPPIDQRGYLRELARALPLISDPLRQTEMRSVLQKRGWAEEEQPRARPFHRRAIGRLRRLFRHEKQIQERTFDNEAKAVDSLLENPLPLAEENPLIAIMQPREVAFPR
jgi:hypothetical protein